MNTKAEIFLGYLFFSSFLSTMLFVYPLAFYLKNVGAETLPYAMIAASIVIPFSTYGINYFAKKSGALENSIMLFYIGEILLMMSFIIIYSMGYIVTSAVFLFIVTYSGLSMTYMTTWMLVENNFNILDFKKYCSNFLATEEFGAATSCLIMLSLIQLYHIYFFVYVSIFISLIILCLLFSIKNERSYFVKISEEFSLKNEMLNIQSETLKEKIVILVIVITIAVILFESSIYYEVGFALGKTFASEAIMNEILYKIRLIATILTFAFNVFGSSYLVKNFNIGNIFFIFGCLMAAVFINVYFFPEWYVFSMAAIIRYVTKYSFYALGVEQTLNSLVSYKKIQVKSFLDSIIIPSTTILSGCFLLLFSTIESFSILNILLLICAIFIVLLSNYYQKFYELYHLRFVHSKDKHECIQSIHALGSSAPESIKNETVNTLTSIMKSTTSNHIRSNVIKALGEIKKPALEQTIFNQMRTENELVQIETINTLGKYNTFASQNLLINSILFGKFRLSNWSTRLALYHSLYEILGKGIVPILLPSLHSKDAKTVAHTIDALSIVSDQRLIEIIMPFLNHQNARVRGSAIIFLYAYKQYRPICLTKVEDMYRSADEFSVDTAIFVIGKLKLKKYEDQLVSSLSDSIYTESHYVKLAFALSCFENENGYRLLCDFFLNIGQKNYTPQYIDRMLLHYNQIDKNIRFRIVEQYIAMGGDPVQLMQFFSASALDFMDEIQLLKDTWRMSIRCAFLDSST